jgi:hypothetical protein
MTQTERWFARGILDLPAAARMANCSVRRFRRLARTGKLPFRAQRRKCQPGDIRITRPLASVSALQRLPLLRGPRTVATAVKARHQ